GGRHRDGRGRDHRPGRGVQDQGAAERAAGQDRGHHPGGGRDPAGLRRGRAGRGLGGGLRAHRAGRDPDQERRAGVRGRAAGRLRRRGGGQGRAAGQRAALGDQRVGEGRLGGRRGRGQRHAPGGRGAARSGRRRGRRARGRAVTPPPLVLAGHGSRDEEGAAAFRALASRLKERLAPEGIEVAGGFIELFFFLKDTATTEIYTLSLHDALPI